MLQTAAVSNFNKLVVHHGILRGRTIHKDADLHLMHTVKLADAF